MKQRNPLDSAHYRWRRFRARVFSGVAALIIGLAVLVGVGRLLVPYADELRPFIESKLSAELDAQVTIESVKADWPGFLPSILLTDLSIESSNSTPMTLELAVLEVLWTNLFKSDRVLINIALVGPEVSVVQQANGQWTWDIESFMEPTTEMDDADEAESPVEVEVEEGSESLSLPAWIGLSLRDARLSISPFDQTPLFLDVTEADFSRLGDQYRLSGWIAASLDASEEVRFKVWMRQVNGVWTHGQAWLKADDVPLSEWLRSTGLVESLASEGRLNGEAWLRWSKEEGGVFDADLSLDTPEGVLSALLKAERWPNGQDSRSWAVEAREMTFNRRSVMQHVAWGRTEKGQALAADFINLSLMNDALSPWFSGLTQWPKYMAGEVQDLSVGVDLEGHFHEARGQLTQFGLGLVDPNVLLSDLDIELMLSGDRLGVVLGGAPALQWPDVIQAEVSANSIEGLLLLNAEAVEFDGVSFSTDQITAKLDGGIYVQDSGRPFIDLLIQAPRIESVDPRPFLPAKIIPPASLRWLNDALTFIGQAQGEALLYFPAGLKTRDFQPGNLAAQVNFDDLSLTYLRNWPEAREVAGTVDFLGQGLSGNVDRARVAGLSLSAPRIAIDRFAEPVLDLELSGLGVGAQDLSDALGALPLRNWNSIFAPLNWSGGLNAELSLAYPIRNRLNWQLSGHVDFLGNELAIRNTPLTLSALTGRIDLDREAIVSEALVGQLGGQSIDLDTKIRFGEGGGLRVDTKLDIGQVLQDFERTQTLASRVTGSSEVALELFKDRSSDALTLDIVSPLEGSVIALPAPFGKSEDQIWPTRVRWQRQEDAGVWSADIRDRWAMSLLPTLGGWSGAMRFGSGPTPQASEDSLGLSWTGRVDRLDVDGWRQLLTSSVPQGSTGGGSVAQWIDQNFGSRISGDLEVDTLEVPGVASAAADLEMRFTESQWIVSVQGSSIRGEILLPVDKQSGRSIVVDLEHLYLVADDPELEADPISAPSQSDPREVTPLTLLVRSLYWGDLVLGTARLETHATNEGWEIELVDIDGPDLRLQARGDWSQVSEELSRSRMQGRLSSRNFNRLIRATGYQAGLQAGQATVDFDLAWPGALLDFSLLRLNGSLDFTLRSGNIPQASAGAGRLLGLVSFSALPRRLMLDFRDVFSSGFQFDTVDGRFSLAEGQATAERVEIASTAARINLTGTTDMIARTYDQSVVIEPVLGSTLPVIGGLAGGPVGAAAGFLLQSILGQPLKGVSQASYAVTGSWSDPLIELVDAQVIRADEEVPPQEPPDSAKQPESLLQSEETAVEAMDAEKEERLPPPPSGLLLN